MACSSVMRRWDRAVGGEGSGGGRAERAGDGDCGGGGGGGKRVLLRILPGLKEGEVVKNLHQLLYGLGR